MLRKIECYIQPSKLDSIKDDLIKQGIDGMTISEVEGFGRQRGHANGQRPNKKVKFLPKTKLEIVDETIKLIVKKPRLYLSNNTGDG